MFLLCVLCVFVDLFPLRQSSTCLAFFFIVCLFIFLVSSCLFFLWRMPAVNAEYFPDFFLPSSPFPPLRYPKHMQCASSLPMLCMRVPHRYLGDMRAESGVGKGVGRLFVCAALLCSFLLLCGELIFSSLSLPLECLRLSFALSFSLSLCAAQ